MSNTGVVWAGENHGCPCRFHNKSSAETKRETVGVGRHPERPERLQKIMEAWQKNTYICSIDLLMKFTAACPTNTESRDLNGRTSLGSYK
jgi:hypothetical protein